MKAQASESGVEYALLEPFPLNHKLAGRFWGRRSASEFGILDFKQGIKMDNEFELEPINFEGPGYYGYPEIVSHHSVLSATSVDDPYAVWIDALNHAKSGEFESMPRLMDGFLFEPDDEIAHLSTTLLGDAGTPSCLHNLKEILQREIKKTTRYELIINVCDALFTRGLLEDIPLLLSAYETISYLNEADIIPAYISRLLEYPVGTLVFPKRFANGSDYHDSVIRRYQLLKTTLGGEQVHIFGGKLFSVEGFTRLLLEQMRQSNLASYWRRKFEASTGIDCTSFYREGNFQPGTAASIVEAFLKGPEVKKYKDGVRYFFGHRIPQ